MSEKKAFRPIVVILGALLVAPVAARATTPAPDWILIPIVASHARDATGAVWSSTFSFNYTYSQGTRPSLTSPSSSWQSQPGERCVLNIHAGVLKASPGVIIVTNASASKQLSIQFYGLQWAKLGVGVSFPSIRLSDIKLDQPVRLVGIALNAETRTLVRIYGITGGRTGTCLQSTGHTRREPSLNTMKRHSTAGSEANDLSPAP